MSAALPAPIGEITRIGFDGQAWASLAVCACAETAITAASATAAPRYQRRIVRCLERTVSLLIRDGLLIIARTRFYLTLSAVGGRKSSAGLAERPSSRVRPPRT